ncbi:hypothetical protein BTVI_45972 [Pitangus sulphuratus]|nr:hypothetical protein BTVI_45972 [Pitangus sulphuratus]
MLEAEVILVRKDWQKHPIVTGQDIPCILEIHYLRNSTPGTDCTRDGNSPTICHGLVQATLENCEAPEHLQYINDIIVWGNTAEEVFEKGENIIQILLKACFAIKWSKVKGPAQEIHFLGVKWKDRCYQIPKQEVCGFAAQVTVSQAVKDPVQSQLPDPQEYSEVIYDCETCATIKQVKRVKPLWYGVRWTKYRYEKYGYGKAWQIDYITLLQTCQGGNMKKWDGEPTSKLEAQVQEVRRKKTNKKAVHVVDTEA